MKIAMIRAYDALQEANLGSRLILQIHDELVVEIAPGEEKQATALVKDAMEHAVTMAVGRIDGHRFRLAIGGPLIRSRRIIEG